MVNFSISVKRIGSPEISNLMKLAADPTIISFAGGMPDNKLFSTDIINELYESLPIDVRQAAFQYGPTEGHPLLIEALKLYLRNRGLPVDRNSVLITTGGQQALNLVAKVLIDPGQVVLAEYPSFIGAIAAFKYHEASLVSVDMDEDGIMIDALDRILRGRGINAKILYVIPNFHNPAGIIYSRERRDALIDLLRGKDICLLEDDPYSELYFDEVTRGLTKPFKAMEDEALSICYSGSFSKIFGPGMRLGWLLGPREIIQQCGLAKQALDACTSTFTQVLAYAYLTLGKMTPFVSKLRKALRARSQIMLETLEREMPEGVTWTHPKGGFFIWVRLPEGIDSSKVFRLSVQEGAAFVIGSAFDPEDRRNNCFRLAFSHTPEERIEEGIKIISKAVKSVI